MPSKILVHPGFHKTGTSSLQRGALELRERLEPHLNVLLTDDVRPAIQVARRYSAHPSAFRLKRFGEAFEAAIANVDTYDPRPLLISAEALVGHIPGRKNIWTYDAAPDLIEVLCSAIKNKFGNKTPLKVWFTTRNKLDWQKSAYWQNLRSTRLTEDFASYRFRLERAADLDAIVLKTQARVQSCATTVSSRIEDCGTYAVGPLHKALELLDVPTQNLGTLKPRNVQPDDAADRLLELNRSSLDDAALSKAKRQVLKNYRVAGATRSFEK